MKQFHETVNRFPFDSDEIVLEIGNRVEKRAFEK